MKSILLPSTRTGVPVFILSERMPNSFNCSVIPYDAVSEILPPSNLTLPICIKPLRKVPLVRITVLDLNSHPRIVVTPQTLLFLIISLFTVSCQIWRFDVLSSISLHFIINCIRSDWERGLHIAGPLLLLSKRNCIAVKSVTIPV